MSPLMAAVICLAIACFVFGLLAGLLISPRLYRSHFADHGTTAGETERSDQYDSATPFGFGRTNQKGTS